MEIKLERLDDVLSEEFPGNSKMKVKLRLWLKYLIRKKNGLSRDAYRASVGVEKRERWKQYSDRVSDWTLVVGSDLKRRIYIGKAIIPEAKVRKVTTFTSNKPDDYDRKVIEIPEPAPYTLTLNFDDKIKEETDKLNKAKADKTEAYHILYRTSLVDDDDYNRRKAVIDETENRVRIQEEKISQIPKTPISYTYKYPGWMNVGIYRKLSEQRNLRELAAWTKPKKIITTRMADPSSREIFHTTIYSYLKDHADDSVELDYNIESRPEMTKEEVEKEVEKVVGKKKKNKLRDELRPKTKTIKTKVKEEISIKDLLLRKLNSLTRVYRNEERTGSYGWSIDNITWVDIMNFAQKQYLPKKALNYRKKLRKIIAENLRGVIKEVLVYD